MEKIKNLIKDGESITVEFKESRNKLNKDVFESVCAFLNRSGGHLFLGIKDNGEIIGIYPEEINKIKKDFVTSLNNSNKINPPAYIAIEEIEIDGKKILHSLNIRGNCVAITSHHCNEVGNIFTSLYS